MDQDQSAIKRHVVLYGKPGCHLCEEALRLVQTLRDEFDLTIEERDISNDRVLALKYLDRIPVLVFDNQATLTAPILLEDVRTALKQ
jgi:hypothetical protein